MTVQLTATDNLAGPQRTDVYVDPSSDGSAPLDEWPLIGTAYGAGGSVTWFTGALEPGWHRVRLALYDVAGNASVHPLAEDPPLQLYVGVLGDCNRDGSLDAADFSATALRIFGLAPDYSVCDANSDGQVDAGDFSCLSLRVFGETTGCATPLPCDINRLDQHRRFDIGDGTPQSQFIWRDESANACAVIGSGWTRNWDGYAFAACATFDHTVTLNALSLSPFDGSDCGASGWDVNALLYREPHDPAAGCQNLVQDTDFTPFGVGALTAGESWTFQNLAPGSYRLVLMQVCDDVEPTSATGEVDATLDFRAR